MPAIAAIITNVLEFQYVLQKRLPGRPLQDVLFTVSSSEKLELTTMVAEIFIKMEDIIIEDPGVLSGTQPLPWTSTSLLPSTLEPTVSGFDIGNFTASSPLQKQSLASLLSNLLSEQRNKYVLSPEELLKWNKLLGIVEEMKQAGLFTDSDITNVLWHGDVCARHIFVDRDKSSLTSTTKTDSDSTSELTKFSNLEPEDGDVDAGKSSVASQMMLRKRKYLLLLKHKLRAADGRLPGHRRVLTRVLRTWLWFNELERIDSWDGDCDCAPERVTPDELTVKSHFDRVMQQADPDYMDDTYFRGVWIRRLFRFTESGIQNTADFVRYDKFVEEWKQR